MTSPNPFEQQTAVAAPAQPPANPFGTAPVAQQPPASPFPAPAPVAAQPNPFPAAGQQVAGQATYGAPVQQQWQQPAAQQAPAGQPPALDLNRFGSAPPPEAGGGKGAQLADMYGRLVIVFPFKEETVPRKPEHITVEQRAAGNINQQKLTATVVVLDRGPGTPPGGTIEWGGKPHAIPATPHTNSDPLPYVRKSMWINQTRLIGQARDFLPQAPGGTPGMMVGRVHKSGPAHNDPWYLAGASPEEMALAQTYVELVQRGVYPHPLGA